MLESKLKAWGYDPYSFSNIDDAIDSFPELAIFSNVVTESKKRRRLDTVLIHKVLYKTTCSNHLNLR